MLSELQVNTYLDINCNCENVARAIGVHLNQDGVLSLMFSELKTIWSVVIIN